MRINIHEIRDRYSSLRNSCLFIYAHEKSLKRKIINILIVFYNIRISLRPNLESVKIKTEFWLMYQGSTYNSLCLHQSVPEWCAVDDKCPPFEVSYRCSNGCCPVWESFIWANTPRGSQIFTHSTSIYKRNVFKLVCFISQVKYTCSYQKPYSLLLNPKTPKFKSS